MKDDGNVGDAAGAAERGVMGANDDGIGVLVLREVAQRKVGDDRGKALTDRGPIIGPNGHDFGAGRVRTRWNRNTGESTLGKVSVSAWNGPGGDLRNSKESSRSDKRSEVRGGKICVKSAAGVAAIGDAGDSTNTLDKLVARERDGGDVLRAFRLSCDTVSEAGHTDARANGEIVVVLSAFKEGDDSRRGDAVRVRSKKFREFSHDFFHCCETTVAPDGINIEECLFPTRKRAGG